MQSHHSVLIVNNKDSDKAMKVGRLICAFLFTFVKNRFSNMPLRDKSNNLGFTFNEDSDQPGHFAQSDGVFALSLMDRCGAPHQ